MPLNRAGGLPMEHEKHCPDPSQLLALNRDQLDGEALESISEHVVECDACESLLVALDAAEDGIVSNLRQFALRKPGALNADWQRMEARAKAIARHQLNGAGR